MAKLDEIEAVEVRTDAGDAALRHQHSHNAVWTKRTRIANRKIAELENDLQKMVPKDFKPLPPPAPLFPDRESGRDIQAARLHAEAEVARRAAYHKDNRAIYAKASQRIDATFDELDVLLQKNTERAASRALARTEEAINRAGIPVSRSLRRGLAKEAAKQSLSDEFEGRTWQGAMDKQRTKAKVKLRTALNAPTEAERRSRVKYGIEGGPNQNSPYPGGTTSRAVRTIFVSEQSRAMRNAEVALMKRAGLTAAYWRLSSKHPPHYKGKEVCEHLAFFHDTEVVPWLEGLGRTAGVDLKGLYLLDNLPAVPHPNCLCYREPFVLR